MLNLVQAEVLKYRKMTLVTIVAIAPLFLTVLFSLITVFARILSGGFGRVPSGGSSTFSGPDMGGGLFGLAGNAFLVAIAGFYALGMVLIAALVTSNEFSLSTIKMIATREPSRARIVLAKILFMATFAVFMIAAFIVSWLVFTLVLKLVYGQSLGLVEGDAEAIGKGIKYIIVAFLFYFVWSLLGVALGIRFKSIVATVIIYIVYSGIDGVASTLGGAALNGSLGTDFPAWLKPIIELLKIVSPFLMNTNFTRLTSVSNSPGFVSSISPVQSVLVIVAWGIFFSFLAIQTFKSRDITD
ncbi:MAG TPA: ABC transporter permease [Chloroflexia bacterium]|nr:ABC transporter permease [Chloroflexia bacterium]